MRTFRAENILSHGDRAVKLKKKLLLCLALFGVASCVEIPAMLISQITSVIVLFCNCFNIYAL